ncbi:hypothetical protein G7085_16620 [Tessaracoccus sp. HDW20]|uniref:hypothetical protein n=1 Tax=Tessaracoccus coleopterorum TaxID=2714950 RepID=UPI0018D36711|nr:hypothetical protein [Tessaracoccus coleopterorum]NHB85671.1 hypothetical protein [Tessaracoccus coleopterorum]
MLRALLWILFTGWALLLVDAWRLARPTQLARRGRLGLTLTTLLLVVALGGVTNAAASALTGAVNVGEVFQGGGDTDIKDGRYNILLLGRTPPHPARGCGPTPSTSPRSTSQAAAQCCSACPEPAARALPALIAAAGAVPRRVPL